MPIQYINTGTAPNQGNGDTLRTAFTKINNNFDVLFNNLAVSDTVGEVITHPELQRGIAVTYNSSTQQASFLVNIASSSTLGGVKIGSGITVDPQTGVISAASSSFDGNYNSLSNIPQALGINDSPNFAGLTSTGTIYQGTAYDGVDYPNTSIRVDSDVDTFAEMIMKNHNSGTSASTDLVIMNDQGSDTEHFIDLGINSSNYTVQQYSSTQPGDGYLFVNGGDLVLGTQTPNKKIVFHAGGTRDIDSTAFFNEYAWQFNRPVTIDVDRPVPLNFTVINRSSNVVAQSLFQAVNNLGNLVHFGINSSHPEAFYGRIGPNEAFLHIEDSTSTLHIGSAGDLVFYSDQANGYSGTPTLVMSSIDQSSTFDGHILPTTDLTYDLGSADKQWRSLYVGTSTIFIGGVPITVDTATNTLQVGSANTTTITTVATFNPEGHVVFPDGSVQVTAYTGSADEKIWIETFASDAPSADFVQGATSVEYDADGNVIALFSHYEPDPNSSYTSVAKLTPTGAVLWQVRFAANLYTDGWGLAYDTVDNIVYVAGRTSGTPLTYEFATLTKLNGTFGNIIWSKTYDFEADSTSAVVDVDSNGNPVMVGYSYNGTDNYIITTKIDKADGSVVWSKTLDGQGDDQAYGMAIGPSNEIVTIGYVDQYSERTTYSVTPQTGSTTDVLVVNRSDLNSATITISWEVAGTGITGYNGISQINAYNAVTGTVRQGSGAAFNITNNGDGTYSASIAIEGTNYLVGHKIKVLGSALGGVDTTNDCIITVDVVDAGAVIGVSNSGTAAGTETATYSGVTGTNYQTGSGLSFDFFGDAGSTYTEHNTNIISSGTNYVLGDTITIPGTQLGGTTPENDLIATVNADGGAVTQFMSFSGNQQTTTYRILVTNSTVDFGSTGTWTLNSVSVDNNDRMVVVKYATDGTIAWQKAVQFDAGYNCGGADADIDSAGNIYVCGQYQYDYNGGTTSAMSLVKFNSSGVKQWSRRVVGNCDTFGTSVVVGDDDQLYLSGITANNNASDYTWVVAKYNTDGVVTWQRLIDNTTTWTFGGSFWFGGGGGSNIAVKNGYVALAGAFGDPGTQPLAVVLQIDTDATPFSVGDWDIKGATFSGLLNASASDIVVVDANKPVAAVSPAVGTFASGEDTSNFLTITRYSNSSGGTGDITFDGVKIIGDTTDDEVNAGGIKLIPNIAYEGTGQYVKIYPTMGQDAPHIHMAAGTGGDLLIGDDNHYMDVNHTGDIIIKAETDNSNKVRNLVENFQSNIWNGSWTSAEWSGTQIYFTEVSGSLKRWIIKYLDQSRVLGRSLIINNNVNLTYNGYSTEINGGFTIFVSDPAPSEPTAVTTMSAACTMENYVEVNAAAGQLGIISRSGWNVNISAGYESDVNIDAGDDIRITAGTKVRSDAAGGTITIEAGDGGMGDHNDWGGEGGAVNIYGGNGGVGSSDWRGGDGANVTVRAGLGGASNGAGGGDGGILQLLGGDSYNSNAGGDVYIRPGISPTSTSGSGMVIIETVSTASVTNTWQFTNNGTTALPGALVNSTVAKTGSGVPGTGQVATLTLGTTNNTNFTPGVYPGISILVGTGYTITLTVAGNGDLTAEVTASGTGFNVGNQATMAGSIIAGGSSPADDITLTVATLSNVVVATELDLTKSVNKLTNGSYTLADGVEGQIMHLVRQTGATYNAVMINVANARVDGALTTTIDYYPFETSLNMSTLIFTDGAWQASAGGWD